MQFCGPWSLLWIHFWEKATLTITGAQPEDEVDCHCVLYVGSSIPQWSSLWGSATRTSSGIQNGSTLEMGDNVRGKIVNNTMGWEAPWPHSPVQWFWWDVPSQLSQGVSISLVWSSKGLISLYFSTYDDGERVQLLNMPITGRLRDLTSLWDTSYSDDINRYVFI